MIASATFSAAVRLVNSRVIWNVRTSVWPRVPFLCRFSAAGMTVSPRTPTAGGRKAPRQEIAGWERRWCRNYGDFAAGAGVDVAERGGKVRNFATRDGRELGCERVTDRLCNAILRFWVSPNGNIDVTTQGITLSAGSQHRHWAYLHVSSISSVIMRC